MTYPFINKNQLDLGRYLDDFEDDINAPELVELLRSIAKEERDPLTPAEVKELRANSWGHRAIVLAMDTQALVEQTMHQVNNCGVPSKGFPFTTYDEAAVYWYIPVLLERLQEAEGKLLQIDLVLGDRQGEVTTKPSRLAIRAAKLRGTLTMSRGTITRRTRQRDDYLKLLRRVLPLLRLVLQHFDVVGAVLQSTQMQAHMQRQGEIRDFLERFPALPQHRVPDTSPTDPF